MLTYIGLWILVLIIGTIICFKILRSIAKTIAIVGFIFLLFIAITFGITYSDIQELKEELNEQEKVIILHEDQAIIFSTVQSGSTKDQEYKQVALSDEELQKWFEKEELKYIKSAGSYYKVIAVEVEVFNDVEQSAQLLSTITDSNVEYEKRTSAYAQLEAATLDELGIFFLIEQAREENIIVYPKTMFFYIIEFMPDSIINKMIE